MTDLTIPERLGDVSASAALIYTLLYYGDDMAQHEIVERTGLSERTVRNKADELADAADDFTVREHPQDGRKNLYTVGRRSRRSRTRR